VSGYASLREVLDEIAADPVQLAECGCGCGRLLSLERLKRGGKFSSDACRARYHDARDPRLSKASDAQLHEEILRRMGSERRAVRGEPLERTARALTRNVRVLKSTWALVRAKTPLGENLMQTLDKMVWCWCHRKEDGNVR
jgi:hypothetical protein